MLLTFSLVDISTSVWVSFFAYDQRHLLAKKLSVSQPFNLFSLFLFILLCFFFILSEILVTLVLEREDNCVIGNEGGVCFFFFGVLVNLGLLLHNGKLVI